jgi:hypothetical protein
VSKLTGRVLTTIPGAGWQSRMKWSCWRCELDPHCPARLQSARYAPAQLRIHSRGFHNDENTEERFMGDCKQGRDWYCPFDRCDNKQ